MSTTMSDPAIKNDSAFADAILTGFAQEQKSLPPRFLYDTRGSELFEEITRLEEYYPTNCDIEILTTHGKDMAAKIGSGAVLVEFGSGSSRKTPLLLGALDNPAAYVPIDIAEEYLLDSANRIKEQFPRIPIYPLPGNFRTVETLPADVPADAPRSGFFPGSTIGNFKPENAVAFLKNAGKLLGDGAGFIVGIDLQKDEDTLIAAYDDSKGVTAAFNLNLLTRMNRELGGAFDLDTFKHEARYNRVEHRIEMHLVSQIKQTVRIMDRDFPFEKGESIHTENSHKHTIESFEALAAKAGWVREETWLDSHKLFSVHYLVNKG